MWLIFFHVITLVFHLGTGRTHFHDFCKLKKLSTVVEAKYKDAGREKESGRKVKGSEIKGDETARKKRERWRNEKGKE